MDGRLSGYTLTDSSLVVTNSDPSGQGEGWAGLLCDGRGPAVGLAVRTTLLQQPSLGAADKDLIVRLWRHHGASLHPFRLEERREVMAKAYEVLGDNVRTYQAIMDAGGVPHRWSVNVRPTTS